MHIALLVFLLCSFSCKKGKNGEALPYRVHSISDGNFFTHTYTYDNLQRISRIDYDAASSIRFEYNASGLLMQQYNGNTPDPDRKYDLTIVNGRAVKGRQYLPGNKLNEYNFEYDNANRLSTATIILKTAGAENERHFYTFHYNAQDDLAEAGILKTVQNKKVDSSVHSFTYYTSKPFLNWADLGYSYFGKASFSVDNLGYGTTMPQLYSVIIRPRTHALATLTMKNYAWDINLNAWKQLGATSTTSRSEADYVYDGKQRLSRAEGLNITWK